MEEPQFMSGLRLRFLESIEQVHAPQVLTVAVRLPSGAIEVITNTQELASKIEYYKNAYDEMFWLKANKSIAIVGFMLV